MSVKIRGNPQEVCIALASLNGIKIKCTTIVFNCLLSNAIQVAKIVEEANEKKKSEEERNF